MSISFARESKTFVLLTRWDWRVFCEFRLENERTEWITLLLLSLTIDSEYLLIYFRNAAWRIFKIQAKGALSFLHPSSFLLKFIYFEALIQVTKGNLIDFYGIFKCLRLHMNLSYLVVSLNTEIHLIFYYHIILFQQ